LANVITVPKSHASSGQLEIRAILEAPTTDSWRSIAAPELAYRADIDGLRAVAVLSVVGFHASPQLITGGFIGVDIFSSSSPDI